jgi:hypothetical protein
MKLINSESPVLSDMSINPVFQIFGDDRPVSKLHFIVHICPSHNKQMTSLMHIPLIHDTFSLYFNKLMMDISRANVFHIQKSNHSVHLLPFFISTQLLSRHLGLMTTLDLQKPPVKDPCG